MLKLAWLTAIAFCLLSCGGDPQEGFSSKSETKTVQLRLASSFHSTAPIHGESLLHLVDRIDAASAGTIKFKVYDPDKLVAAFEVLDAVSTGKVDAGFSASGYWKME